MTTPIPPNPHIRSPHITLTPAEPNSAETVVSRVAGCDRLSAEELSAGTSQIPVTNLLLKDRADPLRPQRSAATLFDDDHQQRKRRPAWRQKLIEAERGVTQGLRGSSALFGHLFGCSVVLGAGFVIGLELMQWTVLIVALTMVLAAEMFNQVLKALWQSVGHHLPEDARRAVGIGTAAVFVTLAGATLTAALIFGQRFVETLGD